MYIQIKLKITRNENALENKKNQKTKKTKKNKKKKTKKKRARQCLILWKWLSSVCHDSFSKSAFKGFIIGSMWQALGSLLTIVWKT